MHVDQCPTLETSGQQQEKHASTISAFRARVQDAPIQFDRGPQVLQTSAPFNSLLSHRHPGGLPKK